MKFASWSVKGLRARIKGNFESALKQLNADIFAVQDIQMNSPQEKQVTKFLGAYEPIWNFGEHNGRAGTAVFSCVKPKNFSLGLGDEDFDRDGRTITLEFDEYFFVNVYIPHYKSKTWIKPRSKWENFLREYLTKLDAEKPVIVCGNFNVAHKPIDLKYSEKNDKTMGFRNNNRENFSALLAAGFVDTFRFLHPTTAAYTLQLNRGFQEKNFGWRTDYFLVSERLTERIADATVESEILGNEHCPITLTLN